MNKEGFGSVIEPLNITATEVEGKIVHVGTDAETALKYVYLASTSEVAAFLYTCANPEDTRPFVSSLFELSGVSLPVRLFNVKGVKISNDLIQEGFVDGDQLFFDEFEEGGIWMPLDKASGQLTTTEFHSLR